MFWKLHVTLIHLWLCSLSTIHYSLIFPFFISYLLSTLLFFPFLLSFLYFSAHFVGTQYPNYWQKCRQFWEFLWWDWDQHPSKTNPIDVAKYWSHLGQIYHLFSTSVLYEKIFFVNIEWTISIFLRLIFYLYAISWRGLEVSRGHSAWNVF